MDTALYQRVREVFLQARAAPEDEQLPLLESMCAGNAELIAEVRSLLKFDDHSDDSWTPAIAEVSVPSESEAARLIGRKIGSYKVKRLVGEGGMGAVYEATEEQPRRTVALKVMRRGVASAATLRRFRHETDALGRLQHPNIAHIYYAGIHDDGEGDTPYFAMELIADGRPITEYADDKGLSVRERLALFTQVCDAVDHGHQNGVIHRDLKPGNVLVNAAGQVKVIDFGVARLTDSDLAITTIRTDVGQIVGTLQYMSPEQCAADPRDLDARSDVYALGLLLFEMLCGMPPYDVHTVPFFQAARLIREQPPRKPSGLNKLLRGDVETIVLKVLQKEPEGRYQSSEQLAADIRRYLDGSAISARPPSLSYQLRILARRNRPAVVAALIVFVVLVVAAVASSSLFVRELKLRRDLQLSSSELRATLSSIRGFFAPKAYEDRPSRYLFERLPPDAEVGRSGMMVIFAPDPEGPIDDSEVFLVNDNGAVIDKFKREIKPPPFFASLGYDSQFQARCAIVADILPTVHGPEIVVGATHRHFDPSVVQICDTSLQVQGEIWSAGHAQDLFWDEAHAQLVVLAMSNRIGSEVPFLDGYVRRWNDLARLVPAVIAVIPAADLARRTVLFPLSATDDYPLSQATLLVRVPHDSEVDLGWLVDIVAIEVSSTPGALCGLTLRCVRIAEGEEVEAPFYLNGEIALSGEVITAFRSKEMVTLASLGLEEPQFTCLDVAAQRSLLKVSETSGNP